MSGAPGDFQLNETVYFVGAAATVGNGDTVVYGGRGTVTGAKYKDRGAELVPVHFVGNNGSIDCLVEQLSKTHPGPLPGGFELDETVYYVYAAWTFKNGDTLVYGTSGKVIGRGIGEGKGHVRVHFPHHNSSVCLLPEHLSKTSPPCGFQERRKRLQLEQEIRQMEAEKKAREQMNRDLATQKTTLEAQNRDLKQKVDQWQGKHKDSENQHRTLTTQKKDLEEEQKKLKTQVQDLLTRTQVQQKQMEALANGRQRTEHQNETLTTQKKDLEEELEKLKTQVQDLLTRTQVQEEQMEMLSNARQRTEDENRSLTVEKQELQRENRNLSTGLEEVKRQLALLYQQHQELQERHRHLEVQHEALGRWSREQEGQRATTEGQLATVQSEAARLQGKVEVMENAGFTAELDKAQIEEEHRHCSPLEFYDVVIDIQRLQDVYQSGWPICYKKESNFELFKSGMDCLSVSITGDFNVGKSWILSKLAKHTFQSGDRVHTQGISVKLVNISNTEGLGKKAFFIDTQGLNSPVMPRAESPQPGGQPAASFKLEQSLQEMKALEEFQRQVVLSVSDVFLFVVGQLSAKNQLDLHLLINAIKDLRRRHREGQVQEQRVFIVHNLRDWTHAQFEAEDYINRIQTVYGSALKPVPMGTWSYLQGIDNSRASVPIRFEHFFLTKDGAPGCQNDQAFQYIRNVIQGTQLLEVSLGERLGHQMHRWLPSFLQLADRASHPKLELRVCEATETDSKLCTPGQSVGKFVPSVPPPAGGNAVTVRTRSLGSMVSLASDDLAYNMSEIPVTAWVGDDSEDQMMRVLTIEVPGLDSETFSCLVFPRSGEADAPATSTANLAVLKKAKGVNKDGIVAELQLTAKVDCYPKVMNQGKAEGDPMPSNDVFSKKSRQTQTMGLYKKFVQSSRERLRDMEPFVCQVVDKGTRSLDLGSSSRSVNFKIELSEEDLGDWDPMRELYTCYSDGILAIGFVQRSEELPVDVKNKFRAERCEPEEEVTSGP